MDRFGLAPRTPLAHARPVFRAAWAEARSMSAWARVAWRRLTGGEDGSRTNEP